MSPFEIETIVAALSLARMDDGSYSESTKKLLTMAPQLARKLNASLTFVNVFEPTQAPPWGDIPMPDKILLSKKDFYQTLRMGKEYALKKYRDEIADVMKQNRLQDIQAVVLEAKDSALGIVSEAVSLDAGLIVTGTSRPSYRYIYSGFSTALSVMASSPVPVLVVPEESNIDWNQEGLKVLVADDLRSDSLSVLRFAANIVQSLDKPIFRHLHVVEKPPTALGLNISDEDVRNFCEQELRRRSQDFLPPSSHERGYRAEAVLGEVDESIERVINEDHPNVIIFGRHRTLKVRPLMIGRMTHRALLDLKRPVIVVPQ